jgi:RNA polymerase-binding transcription factor DksA
MAEKTTYSADELEEFQKIILAKIESAEDDLKVLRAATANDSDNGTEDTSPTFKQFEEGSSTLSKEENIKLAERQAKFILHLNNALLRIKNKTYGICRVTGKLIAKERLVLVPHATLSIEAKKSSINPCFEKNIFHHISFSII